MLAAADIHQHGPAWHHAEGARAEYAFGFSRKRQQADRDIGLLKKRLKLVGTMKNRNLAFVPWIADPRLHLESERLQHHRGRLCHHAKAKESDTPLFRSHYCRATP